MGCSCGTSQNNAQQVAQPLPQNNRPTNAVSAAVLQIENPVNINQKYEIFFPIIRDNKIGTGIKRTYAYKSKVPEHVLKAKRQEYWETRVEGHPEMWQAMRIACESDEADALAILNVVGMKLINKSLQGAYDPQGNKYDVPIFCINPPLVYEIEKETNVDKEQLKVSTLKAKIRCARLTNDIEEEIKTDISVENLKRIFIQKYNADPLKLEQIRFFYGGKEMRNQNLVGEYNVQEDTIITAFVAPPQKPGSKQQK